MPKYLLLFLKWLVALIAIGFVGWKIWQFSLNNELFEFQWAEETTWLIVLTALLAFVNWSIEAIKWKRLLGDVIHLTFSQAFSSVMQGVTTAVITPNRIGSFIGRVVVLPKPLREKGVLLSLLSGLAQFSVTLCFGMLGWTAVYRNQEWSFFVLCLILISLGLWLFFNPKSVLRPIIVKYLKDKTVKNIQSIQALNNLLKLEILGLSAIRFITFSIQYVLILLCFNPISSIVDLWWHVLVVYGLMTVLPGFLFGKLFVREATALLVFPLLGFADNEIVLAGLIIWLINIGIPAIAGALLLIRNKQWYNSSISQS